MSKGHCLQVPLVVMPAGITNGSLLTDLTPDQFEALSALLRRETGFVLRREEGAMWLCHDQSGSQLLLKAHHSAGTAYLVASIASPR